MPASADAACRLGDGILGAFPLVLLAFPPYPQTDSSSSLPSFGQRDQEVIRHGRGAVNIWALQLG